MGRREHQRVDTVETILGARINDAGPYLLANLSLGGVFVLTDRRWAVGTSVSLSVVQGQRVISTTARVTHIQARGVGFAFCRPEWETRAAVGEILDNLLPKAGDTERRGGARVDANAMVAWHQDGVRGIGQLKDISRTGARVLDEGRPTVGSNIWVMVPGHTFSHGSQIPSELRGCDAMVVRHCADGFAVRFETPSAEFLMGLEQLIQACLRKKRMAPAEARPE